MSLPPLQPVSFPNYTSLMPFQEGNDTFKNIFSVNRNNDEQTLLDHLKALLSILEQQPNNETTWMTCLTNLRIVIQQALQNSAVTTIWNEMKYLTTHLNSFKEIFMECSDYNIKTLSASLISFLATINGNYKEALEYALMSEINRLREWGYDFIIELSKQIVREWRNANSNQQDHLLYLAKYIIGYFVEHNSEVVACDLAIEIGHLQCLEEINLDMKNGEKICEYLLTCSLNMDKQPTILNILRSTFRIYKKLDMLPLALQIALKLNDKELVLDILNSCQNPTMRNQLAVLVQQQQAGVFSLPERKDSQIRESSSMFSSLFKAAIKELGLAELFDPKVICRVKRFSNTGTTNLVSALINAGFGNNGFSEKIRTLRQEQEMVSAVAALGFVHLWNPFESLQHSGTNLEEILTGQTDNTMAGRLIALGILCSGIYMDFDGKRRITEQLTENLKNTTTIVRNGATIGVGIGFAGTNDQDILTHMLSLSDEGLDIGNIAISCGLISAGSGNQIIIYHLVTKLMSIFTRKDLSQLPQLALGIGLCYLGKPDCASGWWKNLNGVNTPYSSTVALITEICAYVGSGNTLLVQKLVNSLQQSENAECRGKDFNDLDRKIAILGIAIVNMGNKLNLKLCFRMLAIQFLQYGDLTIKRTVPLALALLYISNPEPEVLTVLRKLTNEEDNEIILNTIFAFGLIGAGTNNLKIKRILQELYELTSDEEISALIEISLGLLHLGKGTLSLDPFNSNGQNFSTNALAGLITTVFLAANYLDGILKRKEYFKLFYIALAIKSRLLITVDADNMNLISIPVHIGQVIDTNGIPGVNREIKGFHTTTTPVVLSYGERAELANAEDYETASSILEGIVIVNSK